MLKKRYDEDSTVMLVTHTDICKYIFPYLTGKSDFSYSEGNVYSIDISQNPAPWHIA